MEKTMEKENMMGTMSEGRLLFKLALPMIFSVLVSSLYNIVDRIFVGRIGQSALTAISLGAPASSLMVEISFGVAIGVNALLSRKLGEKDGAGVSKVAGQGFLLMGAVYVLFLAFGLFGVEAFYRIQTDDAEIIALGAQYTRIVTVCSFGLMLQSLVERLLSSTGRTNGSMAVLLTGAITNLILDPILIFGYLGFPRMGMRGAAITVMVRALLPVELGGNGGVTTNDIFMSLGIMLFSILGSGLLKAKATMLQTEAGYDTCAMKRIEIAEHMRYLPMGYFNENSLGQITSVTTNVMESLENVATRVIMMVAQGLLTTLLIILMLAVFDGRIALVLLAGFGLFLLMNGSLQKAAGKQAGGKIAADEKLVEKVLEYLQGMAEVKAYRLTGKKSAELNDAIQALTNEKTVIMIAHRLKTVEHADQILVVDHGKIVQRGTHAQLMQQDGIYRSFVGQRREAASWKVNKTMAAST